MSGNVYVALFFRILNFGVLIAIGWYFFKRYALHSAREAMNQEKAALHNLEQQETVLVEQQRFLLKAIEYDKTERELLLSKIVYWQTSVKQHTDNQEQS